MLGLTVHLGFIRKSLSLTYVRILQGRFVMSEQFGSQVVSRRKLFLLVGLTASFAVPGMALTWSRAEAQQPSDAPQSSPAPKKKKKKKKAAPTGAAPTPSTSETPKAQ
jgi:hypothetical protein